jgi:hypothetical protein
VSQAKQVLDHEAPSAEAPLGEPIQKIEGLAQVPAPANMYVTPLRFKLGGRPMLSAHLNVETARSERKPSEI